MVELTVEEVLEAGEWFLSIYNDDGDPHQVNLVITRGPGGGECPQRCHERGNCILGRCQCAPGYSGIDCSQGMHIFLSHFLLFFIIAIPLA